MDNEEIKGFHVRGSSSKEKINLNRSLIVYIMHGSNLYAWVEKYQDLKFISNYASNLYYLSDDEVFFMKTFEITLNNKKIEHSKVFKIESLFDSFKVSDIYQDKDIRAEILNFGVDNTERVLMILSGVKNTKEKRDKFITLYDIEKEKVMYKVPIKNKEIIGRLKSNLYNFVGGHIYFANKVIKVRYDIFQEYHGSHLTENQVFDEYSNILAMDEDELVQSGTPLITCLYNRLCYIIRREKRLKPRSLMILPYLHERRIYLNRRHNANQFYTLYHYNNHRYILCLCLDDCKMYVYSETGILIERIMYKEKAEKWG